MPHIPGGWGFRVIWTVGQDDGDTASKTKIPSKSSSKLSREEKAIKENKLVFNRF